jgi:5-methylcytosine-specific restriction endonuclease McrA
MEFVTPPADDYPAVLRRVIDAALTDGIEAGAQALAPITYPRRLIPKRPGLSRAFQGKVYRRDRFTCRYCGGKLIPTPIMELLGEIYPDAFPFHPNWKGGETHPAIISRSPVVDHVRPGSSGGAWRDLGNLVTACWPCNGRKADFTLEQLRWGIRDVPIDEDWDGLTGRYPALWKGRRGAEAEVSRGLDDRPWVRAGRLTGLAKLRVPVRPPRHAIHCSTCPSSA